MLLGKTVIELDIGGIPELVRDGGTGLTFESGDIGDLKNKIEYLNSDKERLQEYGNNARKHVTKLVDLEAHYRKMEIISHKLKGD
jgi:glycosyltransferase involved in cell wall biosynthesis